MFHMMRHRPCCNAAESDVLARPLQNSFLDCVAPKLQLLNGYRDSNILFCVMILAMNCSFFSKFVHDSMKLSYLMLLDGKPFGTQKLIWVCLTEHVKSGPPLTC